MSSWPTMCSSVLDSSNGILCASIGWEWGTESRKSGVPLSPRLALSTEVSSRSLRPGWWGTPLLVVGAAQVGCNTDTQSLLLQAATLTHISSINSANYTRNGSNDEKMTLGLENRDGPTSTIPVTSSRMFRISDSARTWNITSSTTSAQRARFISSCSS